MASITTPNMGLTVPTPGSEPGPTWAYDINSSLTLLDSHNHSSGNGVQINPAGLNINSALTFAGNAATDLKYAGLRVQSSDPSSTLAIYSKGVDLYFTDGNSNHIQITTGGGVAGSPGSISNLVGPASAAYVGGSGSFVWQSAASVGATLDTGNLVLRGTSQYTFGLTLQPPSLGSNYSLTLPPIPASQNFVSLDTSGNFAASWAPDNSTIEISAGSVRVKSQGITATQIANATITGGQVSNNIALPGKAVNTGGNNVVVSNTNTTNSLAVVRGIVNPNGTIASGEGFSVSHGSTGGYTITFTTAFADNPAVCVTLSSPDNTSTAIATALVSGTSVTISTNDGTTPTDHRFNFIAIGQRT